MSRHLVSAILEAELEARAHEKKLASALASLEPATKVCRRCNRTKPVDQFHPTTRICKVCRNREDRERKAARRQRESEETPVPFDGVASTPSPHASIAPSSSV